MIANIYEVTTQQLKDLKFTFPSNAYIFLYTGIPGILNVFYLAGMQSTNVFHPDKQRFLFLFSSIF